MVWSLENREYLEDSWGSVSIGAIAKNLDKSINAVLNKVQEMQLGRFLDSQDYITVNQFMKAIGRNGCWTYTLNQWVAKGFPMKRKKVLNDRFKIIYLKDFWKWAKEYRMHIDFAKFQENALGKEPKWVKEQRKADIEFAKYKITPWTPQEDATLYSLLKTYRYTYRELSLQLKRTEGAIKRRVLDLGILERPLRESPHGIWTKEEIDTIIDMYYKGYKNDVIKEYINKSAQAVGGKLERLIKQGLVEKRK